MTVADIVHAAKAWYFMHAASIGAASYAVYLVTQGKYEEAAVAGLAALGIISPGLGYPAKVPPEAKK